MANIVEFKSLTASKDLMKEVVFREIEDQTNENIYRNLDFDFICRFSTGYTRTHLNYYKIPRELRNIAFVECLPENRESHIPLKCLYDFEKYLVSNFKTPATPFFRRERKEYKIKYSSRREITIKKFVLYEVCVRDSIIAFIDFYDSNKKTTDFYLRLRKRISQYHKDGISFDTYINDWAKRLLNNGGI